LSRVDEVVQTQTRPNGLDDIALRSGDKVVFDDDDVVLPAIKGFVKWGSKV